ncbi:hypothetical protein SSBR45R_50970 [Bradyrhizobium sp. SSBR45R]|nr:hypothetical protein SSBR45R_50970 [Bradyrhizobium sp. SSBR45R]
MFKLPTPYLPAFGHRNLPTCNDLSSRVATPSVICRRVTLMEFIL